MHKQGNCQLLKVNKHKWNNKMCENVSCASQNMYYISTSIRVRKNPYYVICVSFAYKYSQKFLQVRQTNL